MAPRRSDDKQAEQLGRHAAAAPKPLTKREQKRAQKAAQKAADEAAKEAKRTAKAAKKSARKGGGVVATVAATQTEPQASATTVSRQDEPVLQDDPREKAQEAAGTANAVDSPAAEPSPAQPAADSPEAPNDASPIDAEIFAESDDSEASVARSAGAEAGAFVPAGDMSGFERYSRYNVEQEDVEKKPKRKRKRGRVVAAVLIVLACLLGAGFAGASMYLGDLNKNLAGDEEEAQEVEEALTPVEIGDEPFYMLLVGCDDREGVDGARADTTILARLDPKENKVTLLSIPRDTAIEIDGYGTQKFNAAYTFGGPSGTIEATKQLCGVEISHYAEVHFEALVDLIDYIGGVDVDVPIGIDDVDAGGKVDAGMQHLDGEHAMVFARSRSYVNGDFQRTTNQRLLIEAAIEKVLSMDATEYPGLLTKVSQSMTTDFSVQELLGLVLAFSDEPEITMYSAMVPSTTANMDGISYVVADVDALSKMMDVIDEGGDPSTVSYVDTTVTSSKEAEEQGIETIVNEGDDVADGTYDYDYYDPNFSYDYDYTDDTYADDGYYEDDGYYDDSYDYYGDDDDYDQGYDYG